MARKISDRPSASALRSGDLLPIARPGDPTPDLKATVADIASFTGAIHVGRFAYAGTPIGDKTSRPLSTLFATLAEAQAVFPHATALTNEHDCCVVQAAINYAVSRGGGTVYVPPGVFMMTNTADAAAGTIAGTIYIPKSVTVDLAFPTAMGASVNIVGAGKNQTSFYWPADLGWERFGFLCKDKFTNGVLGTGDRQLDWFGSTYEGSCSEFSLIGPAFNASGDVINKTTKYRPACMMHGFGWGSRRYMHRIRIAGFYTGLNIVGDQTKFDSVRVDNNFYGVYFDDENYRLYGNFVFDKCFSNTSRGGAWVVSCSAAIAGSEFNQCFAGEAPYGFAKEHAPLARPWQASTRFQTGLYVFNDGGKLYRCTGPDVGANSASSGGPTGTGTNITDGSVTWDYVSPVAYTSGQTYAQNTVVTRNGSYYLQIMASPAEVTGTGNSIGPVGRNATIVDGTSLTAPHVWRFLGFQPWKTSTAYALGDVVQTITPGANLPGGPAAAAPSWYRCVQAGTSASSGSGPSHGVSIDYSTGGLATLPADGGCKWVYVGTYNNTFMCQNVHQVTQFEKATLGAVIDDNITVGHDYDTWAWLDNERYYSVQYAIGSYSSLFTNIRTRHCLFGVGTIKDVVIENAFDSGKMTAGNVSGPNSTGANILTKAKGTIYDNPAIFLMRQCLAGGLVIAGNGYEVINGIGASATLINPGFKLSGSPYSVTVNAGARWTGTMYDTFAAVGKGDVVESSHRTSSSPHNIQRTKATGATALRVCGVALMGGEASTAVLVATEGVAVPVNVNQTVNLGGYWLKKDTAGATYSAPGRATLATGPSDGDVFAYAEYVTLGNAYWCSLAGTTAAVATSEIGPTGTVTSTTWAINTAVALNDLRIANGNLYQCTTAGTTASSGSGPTGTGASIADGTAVWAYRSAAAVVDGTVAWKPATAWAVSTPVALNELRIANGNLYQATTAGTTASSGTGPTGTGTGISDGTAIWAYRSTMAAWTPGTAYAIGQYVLTPEGNVYICSAAGTSATAIGALPPTGTGTAIVDGTGTLRWNYVAAQTWLTSWAPSIAKSVGNIVYNNSIAICRLINLA